MGEFISKEALLDAVRKLGQRTGIAELYTEDVLDLIRNFPEADVAPVRCGHWIDCEDYYGSYVRCSVCGDEYANWEVSDCAKTSFCPGCGADMRGADNG